MANNGIFQQFAPGGMGEGEEGEEGDEQLMDQLAIDEDLPPLERLKTYSDSDIALQRLVHVKSMADTVRQVGFTPEAVSVVSEVIEARVVDKENDVRLTLAEQIAELGDFYMKDGEVSGYNETVEMLLSQIGKLLTDKELTVRSAAGVALVSIAKGLTKEHLESPVLGMVLCLAHDESEDHRALAAQLLNDMAEAFGKDLCANFCVPELRSLAEDPEFGVRKAAARNMAHICRTIGQEVSEEKMLPVFMQLSKDEIWGVRKSCAEALSDMSACMPSSCRSEQLVQVFTRLSSDMSRWVRFAAFQQLGPLIATMEPEEVSTDILKQFTSMAHGEGETTLYCAFNFPGVLLTVGASRWELLKESYMMLVKDVQWKVRRSLSHSLHEVAAILGQEHTEECLCEQVFDVFIKDLDEVRVGALKNFAAFMQVLSPEKRKTYLEVLTQRYIEEGNVGRDWRVRNILATQIAPLCDILELSDIQETLEPTFFSFGSDPVANVRNSAHQAAGPLLLRYQREGGDFALRDNVIRQITALAESQQFADRQVFVQICEKLIAADESSPGCIELLEANFLGRVFAMSADRVVNVKLSVARMCARLAKEPLKSRLKWETEGAGIDELHRCIEALDGDSDRDVSYYVGVATDRPVPLTPGATSGKLRQEMELAVAAESTEAVDEAASGAAASLDAEMEAAATTADGEQSVPLLAEGSAAQEEAGAEAETEAMDEDDGEEAAGDAEVAAVDVPAASQQEGDAEATAEAEAAPEVVMDGEPPVPAPGIEAAADEGQAQEEQVRESAQEAQGQQDAAPDTVADPQLEAADTSEPA